MAKAQISIIAGVDFHKYQNTGQMILQNEPVFPTLRFGFDIYNPSESKFSFGGEVGPIGRRFEQHLDGDIFSYNFPGMQALINVQYRLIPRIYLDAGMCGAAYGSTLRRNGSKRKMAPGFRSNDYGWSAGAGFQIAHRWAAGYRYTQWLSRMLTYRTIENFGELGPEQQVIETSNHLIYLKFDLINRDK